MEDCLPWVGPDAGAGEECEEEESVETTCDEPTTTMLLHHSGGRIGEIENEVEPRKKGGLGGKCFKIWFCFSLSYTDLICNKLN